MAEILSTVSIDNKGTPTNGGDYYSDISSWEAGQQILHGDLSGNGNTAVVECYNDDYGNGVDGGLEDRAGINGWTTDVDHFITIRAAAGQGHNGDPSAGFALLTDSTIGCLGLRQAYTVVEGIRGINYGTSNLTTSTCFAINGEWITVRNCIAEKTSVHTSCIAFSDTSANSKIENCLLIGGVFGTWADAGNSRCYSCTAVNQSDYGFASQASGGSYSREVFNCVTDTGFQYLSLGTNSTNNASGDSSAPGASPVTGIVLTNGVDFVSPSTGDYTPESGGKLENAGANLYSDFTDDITGYTRPNTGPWEIGAYEIQGAAPVVQWDGPSIIDQDGVENEFFLFDDDGAGNVASRFSGTGAPFVYAVSPISQPLPQGVQVNGVTGNPFGRPIEDGTFLGLVISAGEDEPAELFTDIATISNATWDDTTLTLNGSNATAQLIGTPVNDTDYHYVFNYDVPDGTICYLRFGGGANQAFITGPASGTFNAVYPATGTDYLMQIATDTGLSTFSNFSVKEYSESAGSANSNAFTMTVAAAVGIQDMYINDGGVFKQATPYIKEGGVFVAADAYVRSGGAWVKVHDK